ncbi:MAG: DUF3800 domain-containing protein [Alphaproteobacteria bacterium]|nr:DUF3800 domain-containing protein [Alphaproteobacteria bacterium]
MSKSHHMPTINIYCDESCHLEHDNSQFMVLGAVWLPKNIIKKTCADIRDIKQQHQFTRNFEFKWTQLSPKKIDFYKEIITYFFEQEQLQFRCILALKNDLDHKSFQQTHDIWYYKMYHTMLKTILNPAYKYNIYLDLKEKKIGGQRVAKLKKILSHHTPYINSIQCIDSKESELIQMADIFCGALSYHNNKRDTSDAKLELIKLIADLSAQSLNKTSNYNEQKFNIFKWQANYNGS